MAEPIIFQQDLEASMMAVMNAMMPGTYSNPYTVNISASGGQNVASCP